MSVVVKRLKSSSMEVYVKGAPEVMVDICRRDSCTCECILSVFWSEVHHTLDYVCHVVPDDYEDLLSYYTKRGYRVIAIAGKSIEGLSWLKAQRMKRSVAFLSYSRRRLLTYWGLLSQRTSRVRPSFPWLRHFRESAKAWNRTSHPGIANGTPRMQDDHW